MQRPCPQCGGEGRIIDDPCPKCHGSGLMRKQQKIRVNIRPGIQDGTDIILQGMGNAGTNGGPYGDLYVRVNVRQDKFYVRQNDDLFVQIPISVTQAALGLSVNVPLLDGTTEKVEIPAGIQDGKMVRVKGKGMPHYRGYGNGDLYVKFRLMVPKRLNAKAKALMTELSQALGEEESPRPMSFEED